jgi:UDP-GlcNAc:undecaprenyl-phosphate GlcNAc-1-phosphate transferase
LSILLTQRVEASLSTAMPLLVLGLPLLDTLMVMIQRIRAGRSPFSPDRNHIHHKLLGLGFDHYEAVSIIYLLQAFLVSVGFALRYQYDTVVLGIYLLICVATYALFRWAAAAGWRFQGRATGAKSALSERVRRLREGGWIERWSQIYVAFSIFGYLWFAAVHPEGVSRDIGFLAAGLLLLYIPMYWSHRGQPWANAERAGLYIASVLAVYLMFATPREGPAQDRLEEIFFTALALAVITGIHFARKVRFELTPLDFLVLFMALAFPRFPNVVSPSLSLGLALAEVFVLFYGVELIINRSTGRWNVMRLALIGMLAVVVARGVILG